MATYKAPLRDMQFVLNELLQVDQPLSALPGFAEITRTSSTSIGIRCAICRKRAGAAEPERRCRGLQAGKRVVTTPKGFKEAYQQFCEQGYSSICCDPAYMAARACRSRSACR